MDTFEAEAVVEAIIRFVRGQSLRNYVINMCFICVELILVELNLVILPKIRQFAKFKIMQKFPAIR